MTYELTEDQCAVCAKAVQHFGRRSQLRKVAEELRELAEECDKAADGQGDAGSLALERADVAVVLHQFDNLLLPSLRALVPAKIESQIDRLEKRINEEQNA